MFITARLRRPPPSGHFALVVMIVMIAMIVMTSLAGCQTSPHDAFSPPAGTPPSTIRHIVLIDLKDPADAAEVIRAMDAQLAGIPGIVHYWRGAPFPSGRAEVTSDYDVGLIVDFRDAAAYDVYTHHPRHVELVTTWKPRIDRLTIFDISPQARP
ncbi:MAG: Dabb family protein [Phycisphaerae bacterium]|nr:Dabb family protein [Phycisphaerae bacterium]